jgi:hypothetical protein
MMATLRARAKGQKKDKDEEVGKFKGDCFYSMKLGHRASNCYKKKKDLGSDQANAVIQNGKNDEMEEVALMAVDQEDIVNSSYKESVIEIGSCKLCGISGLAGDFCNNCEDSGMIYHLLNETYLFNLLTVAL